MEKNERINLLARVALMFLDGDDFERVLIDQRLHTDYRFDEFNRLKQVLSKVERLEPDMDVSLILWRLYPTNPYVAEPLVAGNALPNTGWRRVPSNEAQREAFRSGAKRQFDWNGKGTSYYWPLRNSNDDIVGLLEILEGRGYRKDVDTAEMFVETLSVADDDEEEDK